MIDRPPEEHIEIPGATPAIVDSALWARVQAILSDPERTRRRSVAKRHYTLRGRLSCGSCQSAMVGQTLSPKGKGYSYYRCRHAYTRTTSRPCESRYVRADALEQGIWAEVRRMLAAPEVVLSEQLRSADTDAGSEELARLENQIGSLRKREERLVRLFGYDEVDVEVVRAELRDVQRRREVLTGAMEALARPQLAWDERIDDAGLRRVCEAIAARLDGAGPEEHEQVLEAVQLSATVAGGEVTVEGVLPIEPPEFAESGDGFLDCPITELTTAEERSHRRA